MLSYPLPKSENRKIYLYSQAVEMWGMSSQQHSEISGELVLIVLALPILFAISLAEFFFYLGLMDFRFFGGSVALSIVPVLLLRFGFQKHSQRIIWLSGFIFFTGMDSLASIHEHDLLNSLHPGGGASFTALLPFFVVPVDGAVFIAAYLILRAFRTLRRARDFRRPEVLFGAAACAVSFRSIVHFGIGHALQMNLVPVRAVLSLTLGVAASHLMRRFKRARMLSVGPENEQ